MNHARAAWTQTISDLTTIRVILFTDKSTEIEWRIDSCGGINSNCLRALSCISTWSQSRRCKCWWIDHFNCNVICGRETNFILALNSHSFWPNYGTIIQGNDAGSTFDLKVGPCIPGKLAITDWASIYMREKWGTISEGLPGWILTKLIWLTYLIRIELVSVDSKCKLTRCNNLSWWTRTCDYIKGIRSWQSSFIVN